MRVGPAPQSADDPASKHDFGHNILPDLVKRKEMLAGDLAAIDAGVTWVRTTGIHLTPSGGRREPK